ncbi:AAA family ATPase [Candidatus Poriferisodalis sp.]|uniref:AAA family ATPase n=1 Tax=Candidatus Poriferisodalis sp. TaxID=3101277 RepID=UPI003B520696
MRIHRIKLRDFKGVANCEVDIPADGVTIIEGDNEVGKSSLAEAVRLVFQELDTSKKAHIRAAQPVGRDVGPEVEIEASSGGYRFVYRKRWLRRPETVLEISEPRHEQLVHREAHERVNSLLDETLDRVLWDALWVDQGVRLATPSFDVPSLRQSLDASAGGAQGGDADELLWDRVCAERARYWTSTGRMNAERTEQQRRYKDAAETAEGLSGQLSALTSAAGELDRHRREQSQLAENHTLAEREHRELNAKWQQVLTLRNQRDQAERQLEATQAQLETAKGHRARRDELAEQVNAAERQLAQAHAEIDAIAPALALATQLRDEAETEFDTAQRSLATAESELRRVQDDRDFLRHIIEAELLQERHDRVIGAQQQLAQAEADWDSSRITSDLVAEIEGAHLRVVQADARTLSGAANVEISALRPMSLGIAGEVLQLDPAENHSQAVADSLDIEIADVASVRVTAGAEAKESVARLAAAESALRQLCTSVGVSDLSEAREALRRRESAASERETAQRTIKQDLRDLTVEVLEQKIRGLLHGIEEYRKLRPDEPPLPPDYDEARRLASELEEQSAVLLRTRDDRQSRLAERRNALNDEGVRQAVAANGVDMSQQANAAAKTALAEARADRSDQALKDAYDDAERRADTDERHLSELRNRLSEANEESLAVRLENAGNAVLRAERELNTNRERQSELEIELDIRGNEGLHTKLGLAEAVKRRQQRKHLSLESRAQAARLLYETLSRHREAAHRRYLAPFKARIDELGQHVFGPTFAVELDNELGIARRTLDGVTLNVDQLSTGAREQLGILARLACAAIVSPTEGGAPVIIDDALGWSDPHRLERMGAAIASAGSHCQVIILTCTPGRYAHVGNATVVNLPTASQSE